jgi:hypothetical protein
MAGLATRLHSPSSDTPLVADGALMTASQIEKSRARLLRASLRAR